MHGTGHWTVEKIDELTLLRMRGNTFAQIAEVMGVSRGSVTGKLTRLGLTGKNGTGPKRVPRPQRVPKPKLIKPPPSTIPLSKSTPPAVIRGIPPAPNSNPVSILDVLPHHCRSVLTQRDERGPHSLAMFCGDAKTAGSSYCAFHDRLYRAPMKEFSNGQTGEHE